MRKIYLALIFLVVTAVSINAQCVVDVSNQQLGITPPDSLFPAIVSGVALDNSYVTQIHVPSQVNFQNINATVYWVAIYNIAGLPSGLTYARNPNVDTIFADNNACVQFSGTTTDPAGEYSLNFAGLVKLNTSFTGDTVLPLSLLTLLSAQSGGPGFGYKLKVVEPATGIFDLNNTLSQAIQIIPNPNTGKFNVNIDYLEATGAELNVLDVTGKQVYNELINKNGAYSAAIDVSMLAKGIYIVQLKTDKGVTTKRVSVQ